MQTISHIFSKNKSVRMLKNILTEHTIILPFINCKLYICDMNKFNAKELDAVLNQLEIETSFIRLKDLDGDINSNHFIVNDLEKDGYIKVDRMTNNDFNHISLTINGDAFKKLGGYSWLAKREHKEQRNEKFHNIFYTLLGAFLTKTIEWLINKDVLSEIIELVRSIVSK